MKKKQKRKAKRRTFNKTSGQLADLERLFDLRWDADMRAIKRWQKATGKKLTWPDHADLCVWLLEQLDKTGAGQ